VHDDVLTQEDIAKKFNLTKNAVEAIEKRMRARGVKGIDRDPFVTPTGEFEGTQSLRKSQRERWIRRYKNWDVERLRQKCGFNDIPSLRAFAKRKGFKLKSIAQGKPKPAKNLLKEICARISERILENALINPGADGLYDEIKGEFVDELKQTGYTLTKKLFEEMLDTLVWTEGKEGRLTALKEVVKHSGSLKHFQSFNTDITIEMIRIKAKELSGMTSTKISPAKFIRGINRIGGERGLKRIEDFVIPTTSAQKPFPVDPKDPSNWRFMVINAPNIGVKHSRLIGKNPVRQAFSTAERLGIDTVFLTNIIDIDMTKAGGPLKALRALSSGRNINVALLDPTYQEEAARILNDMPDDEVIYETANEAFENLLSGVGKTTHLPKKKPFNGRPEFSGNVCIILGYKEEDFIVTATYWAIRYFTLKKQQKVEVDLKVVNSALAKAKKEKNYIEVERLELEEDKLTKLKVRLTATTVHPQEVQRIFPTVLAYVIQRFEESIPNCKVIGVNTTRIRYGSKTGEFSIPDHIRVTDTLLSNRVKTYGPQTLREELADFTIVCHSYPLNEHATARERDAHAQRGHAYFAVAPMCVDAEFLRSELKHIVRKAHPINKVVSSEQFQPGVLLVECVDGILFPPEPLSIGALDKYRLHTADFTDKKKCPWGKRHIPLVPFPDTRYIYYLIATDIHIGSRNRESIWCEEVGARLGMLEAIFHLMRRNGLFKDGNTPPVHMFSSNDDIVQGNHFETHKQPHVHELSYAEIENLWSAMMRRAKRAEGKSDALRIFAEMRDLMLYQLEIRGLDWTQQQIMEVFERLIEPNIDAFGGILARAQNSGLVVRPISKFENVPRDSRDIGIINCGTGNHFTKTLDKNMVEGPLYADKIRSLLQREERWRGRDELLEKLVKAPLDGNRPIGYGTMQIPGGYEWGIDMRDTPTGGVDWHDPLRPTVMKEMGRGNVSRIMEGKMIVGTYGDKHFFSFIITPWRIFLMGPPGTHTDVFGELGFPPNNTGVVFLGLPVDGPDGGPILLRVFLYDDIKRLIEEKRTIDWEKFLPNAA